MEYIFKDIRNTKQLYFVLSNPLFFNKLSEPDILERVFELYQIYDNGEYNYFIIYFLNKILEKKYNEDENKKVKSIIRNILESLFYYDENIYEIIRNYIHNYINNDILINDIKNIINHYSYCDAITIISKINYNNNIYKNEITNKDNDEYKLFYDILYKKRKIANIQKYYKEKGFSKNILLNFILSVSEDIGNIQNIKNIIRELNKTGYCMKPLELETMFNNFRKVDENILYIIMQLLNKHSMKRDILEIIIKNIKDKEKYIEILCQFGNLNIYPSEEYIIRLLIPSLKVNKSNRGRVEYITEYVKKASYLSDNFLFSIVSNNDIEVAEIVHDNKYFFNEICINTGIGTYKKEWIEFFIKNTYYISDEIKEEIVKRKYWSNYDFLLNLKVNGFLPEWIDI